MRYDEAASEARRLLYGGERGTKVRQATQRALDLAPKEHRTLWTRFLIALEPGHRLKTGVYPVRLTWPPSEELVAEVESAFEGDEGR